MDLSSAVGFNPSFRLGSLTQSGKPALKVIHMCLWDTTRFSEKFVTNIQNKMGRLFGPHAYIGRGVSVVSVLPSVSFLWSFDQILKVLRPMFLILFLFIQAVSHIRARALLLECCYYYGSRSCQGRYELGTSKCCVFVLPIYRRFCDNMVVRLAAVPLTSIATGTDRSGTNLIFMGKAPQMRL